MSRHSTRPLPRWLAIKWRNALASRQLSTGSMPNAVPTATMAVAMSRAPIHCGFSIGQGSSKVPASLVPAGHARMPEPRHQFFARAGGKRLIVINALHQEQPAVLALIDPVFVGSRPAALGDEVMGERLPIEQVLQLTSGQVGADDAEERHVHSEPRQR